MHWMVSHCISSGDEPIVISDDDDSEEVVEELSGSELEDAIQQHRDRSTAMAIVGQPVIPVVAEPPAMQPVTEPSALSAIEGPRTNQEWRKAESVRSLGYNGQSARTKRRKEKLTRDKEKKDAQLREG